MNSRLKSVEQPETWVGICCGRDCGNLALLFKIPGIYRYRCSDCFERETGRRHYLAPAAGHA